MLRNSIMFAYTAGEDGLVELRDISLSPDPPTPGKTLEVTASGYVKETLEVG
jgi:hypothetical protein